MGWQVRGATLPEVMVSAAIGFVIIAGLTVIFLASTIAFAAMGSYINMDRSSRNALDRMTLKIRNSWRLVSYNPTRMVFAYDAAGTINLAYQYDEAEGVLTEEWTRVGDTSKTNTLLTGCEHLTFTLCDRDMHPCSDVSAGQGKMLSVSWKCSRETWRR